MLLFRTVRPLPVPLRLLTAACAIWGAACGGDPSDGGFDLDVSPDDIADHEGKFDGDPCARYPGGPLGGDDFLVLVNKQPGQQLSSDWEPPDLLPVPASRMMPDRTGMLRPNALVAFEDMVRAAGDEEGLELGIRSPYRSYRTQCITFDFKVQEHGLDHARRFSAEPGRSQHQLGTTADITSRRLGWALNQSMGESAEGKWLAANAHRFGFALSYPSGMEDITGYAFEPWHYRYIGREAAAEMEQSGMILEQYLESCQDSGPGLACPSEQAIEVEPNQGFIGGRCEADADCASIAADAVCLSDTDGYPGGSCSLSCDKFCPDRDGLNSSTFCVAGDDDAGLCHSKCDTDLFPGTGCREGYACVIESRPNNAGTSFACVPA